MEITWIAKMKSEYVHARLVDDCFRLIFRIKIESFEAGQIHQYSKAIKRYCAFGGQNALETSEMSIQATFGQALSLKGEADLTGYPHFYFPSTKFPMSRWKITWLLMMSLFWYVSMIMSYRAFAEVIQGMDVREVDPNTDTRANLCRHQLRIFR